MILADKIVSLRKKAGWSQEELAVFLVYTFGPSGNGQPQYSWIIWVVAGVLYAAVMGVVRLILRGKKD